MLVSISCDTKAQRAAESCFSNRRLENDVCSGVGMLTNRISLLQLALEQKLYKTVSDGELLVKSNAKLIF